jgi:hypothetical protein
MLMLVGMSQFENWHTVGNNHDRELVLNWLMNAGILSGKGFWELLNLPKAGLSG